ncbi:hypothetical protein ACQJBY_061814 [Aegilops geniculata]
MTPKADLLSPVPTVVYLLLFESELCNNVWKGRAQPGSAQLSLMRRAMGAPQPLVLFPHAPNLCRSRPILFPCPCSASSPVHSNPRRPLCLTSPAAHVSSLSTKWTHVGRLPAKETVREPAAPRRPHPLASPATPVSSLSMNWVQARRPPACESAARWWSPPALPVRGPHRSPPCRC